MDDLKLSLLDTGLSAKEADVYLAMLELGPSSVQDIAKKAGINRTTTYVMMEGLKRHGLMSSFEKGKKVMFVAENPQYLLTLLTNRLAEETAKRDRMVSFIPQLMAIFNAVEDKPKVRFFEGEETYGIIRREMSEGRERNWEFYAVDESSTKLATYQEEERIALSRQLRNARLLMAIKPGFTPRYFDQKAFEARMIDYVQFPFTGSITVAGNKVCILTMRSHGMGIIMDSKEISDIFRAMYEAVWKSAKPWIPPSGWEKLGSLGK